MLTKLNKILIGALVAQLLLVVFVMTRGEEAAAVEQPLLAGFDVATVTRVQVFSGDKPKPLDLVKRGNDWVIASHFDYPADASKVSTALGPLAKLAAAEPVATSSTRHKQLRVGDADFDRKLVVTTNGKDITLFIGGQAGLRRTAVRIGAAEPVFGVAGISASTFGFEPRDWTQGDYYSTPSAEITKLAIQREGKSLELELQPAAGAGSGSGTGSGSAVPTEPTWKVTIDGTPVTLAAGETIDTFAIRGILGDVSKINGTPADPKRDASKPTATITITRANGTDVLDVILVENVSYWVKWRNIPRAVSVDKDRLASALEADRSKLVTKSGGTGTGSGSATPDFRDFQGFPGGPP